VPPGGLPGVVPESRGGSSPSSPTPLRNSLPASPRLRASCGSRRPNRSRTTTRMMSSSAGPRPNIGLLGSERRHNVEVVGDGHGKRYRPEAGYERRHAAVIPRRELLTHLLDRADQPAPAPLGERGAGEDSRWGPFGQPLEATGEIGLGLADQRVQPHGSGERRRVPTVALTGAGEHLQPGVVLLGRPRPTDVP